MALVVGVVLALFVVDGAWEWAAIAGGGAVEVVEGWFWWRWSHRRRATVGVEALLGRVVDVSAGWTEVVGERWRVSGVDSGRATIVGVDGLTLRVEPLDKAPRGCGPARPKAEGLRKRNQGGPA